MKPIYKFFCKLHRIAAFSILMVLASGCRSGIKEKKAHPAPPPPVANYVTTIDGKPCTGWEITNFGPQGPVHVSGDMVIIGMGDGCTGITWKSEFPVMNYEVSLDAKRVNGNDFFCGMTFPVRKEYCTLIVGGWGGTVVGLSSIDGKDAYENSTRTLMRFENEHWYHIRLAVTGSDISAWIDSLRVININTEGRKFSVRPEVELSEPFGIATWNTTAAIKNIEVSRLNE